MPVSRTKRAPNYDRSVFINCPFDDAYRPLFHALLFTIQDAGYIARCALERIDAGVFEEAIVHVLRISCCQTGRW